MTRAQGRSRRVDRSVGKCFVCGKRTKHTEPQACIICREIAAGVHASWFRDAPKVAHDPAWLQVPADEVVYMNALSRYPAEYVSQVVMP